MPLKVHHQNSIILFPAEIFVRGEDGFLAASVIIGKKLILLKAGNHLVVTAWVDVYDTLHQCCFELFAAFVCADVKAGSDHSYLVHFRMYIER